MEDECVEELGRPISGFKVTELRDELTRRGLIKTGNKKELIERLRGAIQKSSSHSTETQELAVEEIQEDTKAPCHEPAQESLQDLPPEDVNTETPAPLQHSQEQKIEETEKKKDESSESSKDPSEDNANTQVSTHNSSELEAPKPQVETNIQPDLAVDNLQAKTQDISQESQETPTEEVQTKMEPICSESVDISTEPKAAIQKSHDSSTENLQTTIDEVNQDSQETRPEEVSTEIQAPSPASFSLKRGSLESRGPSTNKEKRRKWSAKTPESNQSGDSSQSTFMTGGISSQKLQELIEVKSNDQKPNPENTSSTVGETEVSVETPKEKLEEGEINTSGESANLDSNLKTKINDQDDNVDEEKLKVEKEVVELKDSSTLEPEVEPTNILLVQNLVRPFTITQLKEVLTKHGPMNEEKFWTDKVKSKCCVMFETIEIAKLTKESLNGQQWPSSNKKTLKISYIDEEALQKYQKSDVAKTQEVNSFDLKANENSGGPEKIANKSISTRLGEKLEVSTDSSSANDVKKRLGEKIATDATVKSNRAVENSKPQELDDLFKKTKSVPHLFWLPLTDSQADLKQKERTEREKRSQELAHKSRRSPPPKRRSPPRYRSPQRRPSSNRHSIPERRRSRSISRSRSRSRSVERRSSPRYRFPKSRRSPPMRHRSPIDRNSPPPPKRRTPIQSRWSPPPPRRTSPLLVRRSPGLVRREVPTRRSPPSNRRSPDPMRRVPGPARRSPAMIRRSPAPIRGSSPSDRSPPRKRSPMRRRSPIGNFSPNRQLGYSDQHRRPQRLERL